LAHLAEVGAKADSGEGQEEGPAGEVGQVGVLVFGEKPTVARTETKRKPSTNFGNFCQRKAALLVTAWGLAAAGPVDGVGEDDEADEGVAGGFDEDG